MKDIVGSCNGTEVIPSERMKNIYGQELDFERLESQLLMLPDLVKTEFRQFAILSDPFTKLMLIRCFSFT